MISTIRVIVFSLLVISLVSGWWLLALACAIGYVLAFTGYELFPLAVLVDGYYGGFAAIPVVSIVALSLIVMARWLRPYFLLYTES